MQILLTSCSNYDKKKEECNAKDLSENFARWLSYIQLPSSFSNNFAPFYRKKYYLLKKLCFYVIIH